MKKQLLGIALCSSLMVFCLPAFASDDQVLEFRSMVGVDGHFLGAANPIRNVNGGGLPWVLESAKGKLRDDGELRIKVKGLIIPDSVPGFGFNPAPFFRAIVSCLSVEESSGLPVIANVITDNGAEVMKGDPANGDADFRVDVELPDPCVAPVIFVTSPGGSWFSVTGVGSLEP